MPRSQPACTVEFTDLVSDNVRTRLLAPCVVVLAYVLLASLLLPALDDDDRYTESPSTLSPPEQG